MSATPPQPSIESWEVLDLLTSLLQKSLVVYDEDEQGHGRYRLLETVRQYARDRLLEAGEAAGVREQHLRVFLDWSEQGRGLDEKEREHDNLRTALAWSEAQAHAEAGLRLGRQLWWFWEQRGYGTEGREHLAALLALPGAEVCTLERAHVLHGAGRLAQIPGDWGSARALMTESLAICRELGDKMHAAWVLNDLGRVVTEQGEYETARALLEEGLMTCRELGVQGGIAYSLGNLGLAALYQGEYESARALLEESLTLRREHSGPVDIAWTLNCLGRAAYEQEEFGPAQALLEEARTIAREVGYQPGIADSTGHMGFLALYRGDAGAAKTLLEESLALCRELGERPATAWALAGLGSVARQQGDYGTARALHEESLAIFREVGNKPGVVRSLEGLATVAVTQGQNERAACLFGTVERLREEMDVPLPPADRPGHDRCAVDARIALGEEAFAAAWAQGRAMSLEEAVAFALVEEETPNQDGA